jgi:hypothetical protein
VKKKGAMIEPTAEQMQAIQNGSQRMIPTSLEFESRPNEDGTLPMPPGIADQLKGVESVRVFVILPPSDDAEWTALTREQFLKGYAVGDAIYDQLSSR